MTCESIIKEKCCGCTACVAICPHNAVKMVADEQGFLYPKINKSICIDCGLCKDVCGFNNQYETQTEKHAYAAKHKDISIQRKSSSGGVAYALTKKMIDNRGVVYGVIYDSKQHVIYYRASSIDSINLFHGSKYVQAEIGETTFTKIKDDLEKNIPVLFIGTSCYVNGLLSFLRKKRVNMEKLTSCDLICHGVPSPKLFEDYIGFLKKETDFDHFEFRTKIKPWGKGSKNFGCTIYKKNKRPITDSMKARIFLSLFFSNNCLRPHCYSCEYTGVNKPADITIADYWGVDKEHPEFFDINGVSAVITHSIKGEEFFKSSDIIFVESSIDKITRKQANMYKPSKRSDDYELFWNIYKKSGFVGVARKFGGYNIKGFIVRSKLYCFIKKIFRR